MCISTNSNTLLKFKVQNEINLSDSHSQLSGHICFIIHEELPLYLCLEEIDPADKSISQTDLNELISKPDDNKKLRLTFKNYDSKDLLPLNGFWIGHKNESENATTFKNLK